MKAIHTCFLFFILFSNSAIAQDLSSNPYVALSQEFLEANLQRQNAESYIERYESIDLSDLKESLNSYEKQLSFWINTYNAFIQYQLLAEPKLFEDRGTFYSNKAINIGETMVSFDVIEHGIIRNSRWKLGLGYIKKFGASDFEKMFRTKGKDGRVHFALNCGAISCPPVAVYSDQNLDQQMTTVIKFYLPKVTEHNDKVVTTSTLFSWFRGDFGGKSGIKKFLAKYDIIEVGKLDIEYGGYDWTLDLENIYRF